MKVILVIVMLLQVLTTMPCEARGYHHHRKA
jgi:hypothetical protein